MRSPLRLKNDLLNYWNLRQVIYVRGIKNSAIDEQEIFKDLVEQELIRIFERVPDYYKFAMSDDLIASTLDQGLNF